MEKILIFKDGSEMGITNKMANLIRDALLDTNKKGDYVITRGLHGELDVLIYLSEIRCIRPQNYELEV
ncbi:hypothetical protein [Pedobacter mucosus]|uniref:hypothetical protein n=1 Tax=Pedobacter mucosus TaxID=2895286 RepID=UPI001EE3B5A8|nr:hypothetical protein [Pedobacter mucosus]UKT65272.1 hypothetical protein LOK61_05695 [Pedobacter mucosus]